MAKTKKIQKVEFISSNGKVVDLTSELISIKFTDENNNILFEWKENYRDKINGIA